MSFKVSRCGWLPDLPVLCDRLCAAPPEIAGALPVKAGYFTLPYAYLTDENLACDFWTFRVVQ